MTAADFKVVKAYLADARFRGKRALPDDTDTLARKMFTELGRPVSISDPAELRRLGDGAVVRDDRGWVCEKAGEGDSAVWYATRSTRTTTPVLPAWVLDAGGEA